MKRAAASSKARRSTRKAKPVINRTIAQAFDKWMDDFINDPAAFERTERDATTHLHEKLAGEPPSYGARCEAVLLAYMDGKR
jgi:hypothetical protein